MAHGRRASWTGRPRPRIRHRPPQGFARLLQPGARLTGSSNFSPLSTTPASSWRLILERSSRRISDVSNRFWVKNRTYRKQTIKPRLTGARMHIRILEILQISVQNLAVFNPQRHAQFVNFRAFLTETAQYSEIVVTHSKQTTRIFLTETRIACRHDLNSGSRRSKFGLAHSARLQDDVTRVLRPKTGADVSSAGAAETGIVAQTFGLQDF
jgi:hypothetical protein